MHQITGTLKFKGNEQTVNDRFKKREFVLTDNTSQYPQHISFQLTQERCALINEANPGDEITVSFYVRGREWKSPQGDIKYFNSLDAYKIERKKQEAAGDSYSSSSPSIEDMPMDVKDDLPF